MPNHVTNEVIFRHVDPGKQLLLLEKLCSAGKADFEILLPMPLNCWPGSVGKRHEEAFKTVSLDWARLNWGTKWNAYQNRPIERTDNSMTLTFDTAWRPPYGWFAAIFNFFKIDFEYNSFDEGCDHAIHGEFNYKALDDISGDAWKEDRADDVTRRRLHKLKWGVEEFEPEETESAS